MPKGNLYIVSAPSGAGKTSLSRALIPRLDEQGVKAAISVSFTTRAPRPGEENGVHYHFVSETEFAAMIGRGEFFEHAEVFGRRYGTGRTATEALLHVGTHVILDIDWQGARQVKQRVPGAYGIFILPPSMAELELRLRGRGQDSDEVIAARMRQARAEISHCAEYDAALINQDFDRALDELVGLFTGGAAASPRQDPRIRALLTQLLDK